MILAVDTSTQMVGLALFDGNQIVGEMCWQSQNHHTVELAPALDQLLVRCGILPSDLNGIAVALGPGSFTSLRIGLAFVKGLSLALHIPIVGIPTLDILAFAQPARDIPMAVVLHAGRSRFAVGWYDYKSSGWIKRNDLQVLSLDELGELVQTPIYICGELTGEERHILTKKRKNIVLASPVQSLRRPSYLAFLGWKRLKQNDTDEVVELAPIYLHVASSIPD